MMDSEIFFDAIYNDKFDFIKEFIPKNENLDLKNDQGFSLLHAAVAVNRLDIVQYLLENALIPINEQCNEGRTSIFLACENETVDLNIVKILFNFGGDVNIPNKDGVTCLHAACRSGNNDLAQFLLRCNANITSVDNNGYTCLHFLALSNCCTTLHLLLNHIRQDIDINAKDCDGSTALMLAVDVANLEISKELIKIGADINIIGRESSALHLAVVTQQAEIFQILWRKVDFNLITELSGSNNLVKLMVKYGWFFPDRIKIMFEVLDHPKIMSILKPEIKILTVLFYRIRFVKFIHEINILKVVDKFIQIGVNVTQTDLRVFLLNFYRFENRFDILNLLIKKGHANLDDKDIMKFGIELYPNLVPKLLTFCVKTSPLDVINYFTEILRINKNMIKLIIIMLYFCTPNLRLKKLLKEHLTNFCCALINFDEGDRDLLILYKYINTILKQQRVPSLVELSRDVCRFKLSTNCKDSCDFLQMERKLFLPKDVINLLQCKIAVNILKDFDEDDYI